MTLTNEEREQFFTDATCRIGELLGISSERHTLPEVKKAIRLQDPEAFHVLHDFLAAWDKWYKFHQSVELKQQAGHLTSAQYRRLLFLIHERDKTREALVRKAKQLELRLITIRIAPHAARPDLDLELAARIRRDLYAHGPIEIDPDDPAVATHRDEHGQAYFTFTTAHPDDVEKIIAQYDYSDSTTIHITQLADPTELCINCGAVYSPMMPTVCPECNFRDISECPSCGEEIPRRAYLPLRGNLFCCPACAVRVRFRLNDPLTDEDDTYTQPSVIVEKASQ